MDQRTMTTPKNAGRPFSALDDECIRDLHAKRKSAKNIAAALERTEQGIKARLERLGLRKGSTVAKQNELLGYVRPAMHTPTPHELAVAKRYQSMLFRSPSNRSIRRLGYVSGWLYAAALRGEVGRPLRASVLVS